MNDTEEELSWIEKQADLHKDKPALKDLRDVLSYTEHKPHR